MAEKTEFEKAMAEINKEFGKGTIVSGGEVPHYQEVISTGSIGLDDAIGIGGIPQTGCIVELIGWESCLAADTYIKFIIVNPETGIVQDCKGQTIENLYKRFRGQATHYSAHKTRESEYYVMGINENNRIIRNAIADVVKTGKKECFEVISEKGFKLQATAEHKFFTGTNYAELKSLKKGDVIYIHNNTTAKGRNKTVKHAEEHVKYYYKNKPRVINGCIYYRVDKCRLVYEAAMNNISFEEYKKLLNSGINSLPQNWSTIPEGMHIHHEDENSRNDELSNLMLLDPSSHGKIHANNRQDNLRFIAIEDKIASIVSVGEKETYDIKCFFPYNNYVANGFVVHNSGKSTVTLTTIANAQRKTGKRALLIDAENSFDAEYATSLGVNIDMVDVVNPPWGEAGYAVIEKLIPSGMYCICVVDSQTGMIPKKALEGEIGASNLGLGARMNSQVMPKILKASRTGGCPVIMISQFREKIGVMYGSPETTNNGHALKFYAHLRIEFRKTVVIEDDVATKNETRAKVIKNKFGPPFRKATFFIEYGKGIDQIDEYITKAVEHGVIEKGGAWYKIDEENKIQGEAKLRIFLEDNPEFYSSIKEKVDLKRRELLNHEVDENQI